MMERFVRALPVVEFIYMYIVKMVVVRLTLFL